MYIPHRQTNDRDRCCWTGAEGGGVSMDHIEVFKALSNETRLNIMRWLKEPQKNFPPQGDKLGESVDLRGGVCVSSIQEKAGISQSTVSSYLDMLQRCGLLTSERHGKWTYYRRNEAVIQELGEWVRDGL